VRHILHVIGVLVAVCVVGALLLDEGEIVTLVTEDADGQHETQVWVVEIDGVHYLRAADEHVAWLARLRRRPGVELVRGHGVDAERSAYVASVVARDSDLLQRIDRAMAEQHGFADRVWHELAGRRGGVVLVRLLPPSGAPPEIGRYEGAREPTAGSNPVGVGGPS
jgi:hypothetical protein